MGFHRNIKIKEIMGIYNNEIIIKNFMGIYNKEFHDLSDFIG